MVKQILLPLIGVAAFIVAVGLFMQKSGSLNVSIVPTPSSTTIPSTKALTVGGKSINIEIANTKDLRTKGLSLRTSLDTGSGMLFIFDSKNISPQFWMKDMLIPLDLIWIKGNSVVKIDKNVQPPTPGTPDDQLTIYSSGSPVDYVLEVNAGFSDSSNIKVGSLVTLPAL